MNNTTIAFLQDKLSFLSSNPIIYFLLAIFTLLGAFWVKRDYLKREFLLDPFLFQL